MILLVALTDSGLCGVQSVVLVNIIYFLILCFVTLPIYSLVVHMGKELHEEAFPPELRDWLNRARLLHEQVPFVNRTKSNLLYQMEAPLMAENQVCSTVEDFRSLSVLDRRYCLLPALMAS